MNNRVLLLLWLLLVPQLAWSQAQQYDRTAPTLKGLVAWYLGRPGFVWGPQWYDVTGRFHGTLTGGAAWALSTRQGGAYEMRVDGSGDYVSVAAHAALEPGQRTVTLWMKANAGGGAYQALVSNQSDTNFFNILYRPSTSNNLAIYFKTTGGDNALDTGNSSSIVSGVWTHIAAIGGAGTIATYKNCVLNESMSASGTLVASNVALLFGAVGASPAQEFGGALEDIRIYDRILTPQELCQVMRQPPSQLFLTAQAQHAGVVQALLKGLFFHFMRKQ
jgi:hypothetical protein